MKSAPGVAAFSDWATYVFHNEVLGMQPDWVLGSQELPCES